LVYHKAFKLDAKLRGGRCLACAGRGADNIYESRAIFGSYCVNIQNSSERHIEEKEQDASLEVSLQKNYTLCAICGPPDINFSNLLFPTYGRAVEGKVVRAMARLGVLEHNAIAVKCLARDDREKVIALNV
jgi:hypothetical protein